MTKSEKKAKKLISEGNYRLSESYARLCALCTFYGYKIEKLNTALLNQYSLEDDLCLRKIYAKKCFYNSISSIPFGDHILPLTDACYEQTEGKTLIFVQGIE
jgi:hypothetical protein